MRDLDHFDRAEAIADALHAQEGLETALLSELSRSLSEVDIRAEQCLYSLIEASSRLRRDAIEHAAAIARTPSL